MKGFGRIFFLAAFAMLLTYGAFAQVDSVTQRLKALGIDSNIIEHSFHTDDTAHYFKMTMHAVSTERKDLETIDYDPQRDEKERWQLLTLNGDSVSDKWAHDYSKAVNKNIGKTVGIYATRIKFEDSSSIVISFKCNKDNLPDRYSNLYRCNGLAYINKATKQIDKEEFTDSSSFQIEFMSVVTYSMYRNFSYNADEQFNQLISDDLYMDVFIKDKKSKASVTYIYSDYKKVK
ncbi:MAG TPA: hypothetical protein VK559_04055 [Ferruginibacter sp.]|nr:hypothetical protein [Ferruginibacter sp.]